MITGKMMRRLILVLAIFGLALCKTSFEQKLITAEIDEVYDNHADPYNKPTPNTPVGRIREVAATNKASITIISENDKAINVIYYHTAVDEFDNAYNQKADWIDKCPERFYKFITDGQNDKLQFGCQATPDYAQVSLYDQSTNIDTPLIEGKKLVNIQTTPDGLRHFVRFEDIWYVFKVIGPKPTDFKIQPIDPKDFGLDKKVINFSDFWGDDSILIMTNDEAIWLTERNEHHIQKTIKLPQSNDPKRNVTDFYYTDRHILLRISYGLTKEKLYRQSNNEHEFSQVVLNYESIILKDGLLDIYKKIYQNHKTGCIYLYGYGTITEFKPSDDKQIQYHQLKTFYVSEAFTNIEFMIIEDKNSDKKPVFLAYRDAMIAAFDPDTGKGEIISIDPHMTINIKSSSNGVLVEQNELKAENKNEKPIPKQFLRIGDNSAIDFSFSETDMDGLHLIESYKKEEDKYRAKYVIFLVDKKTNETVINQMLFLRGSSHVEKSFRLPSDDIEATGGNYLFNYNQMTQTAMSCRDNFCYEKHIDSKEDPIRYYAPTFGMNTIYHDENEIYLVSAFSTFVYKKSDEDRSSPSHFIQHGGTQMTHESTGNHVIYGVGKVWTIDPQHNDRTNGNIQVKDVYDLLHLNDDLVIMRSHQDVSIRHKDSLDKAQWSAETNVMKDDQFLYKKDKGVYEDKTKHTVITSSYHKYNLLYDSNTHKATMTFMKKNDNGFHDQLSEESFIVHENRVKEGKNERILSPGDTINISENTPISEQSYIQIVNFFCILAIGIMSVGVLYAILKLCSRKGRAFSKNFDKKTKHSRKRKYNDDTSSDDENENSHYY